MPIPKPPCPHPQLSHGGQRKSAQDAQIVGARCAACKQELTHNEYLAVNDRNIRSAHSIQRAENAGQIQLANALRKLYELTTDMHRATFQQYEAAVQIEKIQAEKLEILPKLAMFGVNEEELAEFILIADPTALHAKFDIEPGAAERHQREAGDRMKKLAAVVEHHNAINALPSASAPAAQLLLAAQSGLDRAQASAPPPQNYPTGYRPAPPMPQMAQPQYAPQPSPQYVPQQPLPQYAPQQTSPQYAPQQAPVQPPPPQPPPQQYAPQQPPPQYAAQQTPVQPPSQTPLVPEVQPPPREMYGTTPTRVTQMPSPPAVHVPSVAPVIVTTPLPPPPPLPEMCQGKGGRCDKMIMAGNKYCNACGQAAGVAPTTFVPPGNPQQGIQASAQAQTPYTPEVDYCKGDGGKCGRMIRPGASFCNRHSQAAGIPPGMPVAGAPQAPGIPAGAATVIQTGGLMEATPDVLAQFKP